MPNNKILLKKMSHHIIPNHKNGTRYKKDVTPDNFELQKIYTIKLKD